MAVERQDRSLEASVLSHLGQAYAAMGSYAQSLNHYRSALTLLAEANPPTPRLTLLKIHTYNGMGVLTRDMGDPLAAVAIHKTALEAATQAHATAEKKSAPACYSRPSRRSMAPSKRSNRLRLEGLRRMLVRLKAHDLYTLAQQVQREIERLENPQ